MSEIRNLTRNGETFYPLTTSSAVINESTGEGLVIDDIPTYESENLVKSGGVANSIASINTYLHGNDVEIPIILNATNGVNINQANTERSCNIPAGTYDVSFDSTVGNIPNCYIYFKYEGEEDFALSFAKTTTIVTFEKTAVRCFFYYATVPSSDGTITFKFSQEIEGLDTEFAQVQSDVENITDNLTNTQSDVTGIEKTLNGDVDKRTKIIAYTSSTAITISSTEVAVDIQRGETFVIMNSATGGISANFTVYANDGEYISNYATANISPNTIPVNSSKQYVATADITNISFFMAGSNVLANGNLTIRVNKGKIGTIFKSDLLLPFPFDVASTEVVKNVDRISSVVYKDSMSAVIRTDSFEYGNDTVIETRTLSSGGSVTITTNVNTLNQIIVWN